PGRGSMGGDWNVGVEDTAANNLEHRFTGESNQLGLTMHPAETHCGRLDGRIQDAVGNIGPATEVTASDSQYPAQPTILTVTDDAGAVTGPLKNGGATDANRTPLSGNADPRSTVAIHHNGLPAATLAPS
uniref:hypothetical protein n=1 Tax=Salmonella enterica TaxID=28901 RepID=UPI00398C4D54